MGFEDKGQGFPKKLFLLLKVNHGHRRSRFKKNGGFDFELKKGIKNIFQIFFYSDSFQPGDHHAKTNKSEKIILSAPKTAMTLIVAATLNTAPTVYIYI
jgi:hypothetical protein